MLIYSLHCRATRVWVLAYCTCVWFAAACPAQQPDPAQQTDITRLVHPEVAERLSLNDQQRAQIQQLILERATALAAAKDDDAKAAVRKSFETRVLELLTAEQAAKLAEDQPTQKLSFQFRDMKWQQVLSWFADQQDLTLVMDRIPPGSFTYSDTRTYSPAEAIDLLNSVLMTRGFSLVRREKMLTVMELNDALPVELIPQVSLDQLPQRGRFELVSVKFPLGGRPIDAVLNEVKPYLNSYGRILPLAQGSQVLVIENAGKMQTINELIASIEVPKKAAPTPPPPAPAPVLASYSLGGLDPTTTLAFIRKLIPSENITIDEKAGILSAFVIPTQQTAIQSALTTMQEKQAELPGLQSVAYKLSGITPADFKSHVVGVVPLAKVLTTTEQGLVMASPQDQEKIKQSLAALKIQPIQSDLEMRVFEVAEVGVSVVEAGLKKFLPDSQITSNENAGTVILRGTPGDLRTADEIIQIWKRTADKKQLQLRTFALDRKANESWLATVSKIAPNARLWLGENSKRLLMLAEPDEFTAVEGVLPQLQTLLPEPPASLVPQSYTLNVQDSSTVLSLLAADFPEAKISLSEDAGRITVLADAGMQDRIRARVEQFNQALPVRPEKILRAYQVAGMTPAQLQLALTNALAKATAQVDAERSRLLVWATEPQHAEIAKIVELLSEKPAVDLQKIVVVYPLETATATAVKTLLGQLDSEVTIVADDKLKQLAVTGTIAKQAMIQSAIKQIDRPARLAAAPEVRGYDLKSYQAAQILPTLQALWPDMKMSADSVSNKIVASGTPQELEQFSQAIEKMLSAPAGKQPVVRTYPVPVGDMTTLPAILSQIAPQATVSSDIVSRTVTVLATEELQARVQEAVQQISATAQAAKRPASYQLKPTQLTAAQTAIQSLFPGVSSAVDATTGQIVIVASEQIQQQIASVIELLANGPNAAEKTVRVISLNRKWLDSPTFLTTLKTLIPSQVSLESNSAAEAIIAIGAAEDLLKVEQHIAELTSQLPAAPEIKSVVYRLKHTTPTTVATVAQPIVPKATLVQDVATGTLAVSATANDHQKIEELVRLLDLPKQTSLITKTYRVKRGSGRGLAAVLSQVMTDARLFGDADSGALLATATEEQHQRIQEIIQEYEEQAGDRETRVFSLDKADARSLQAAIQEWTTEAKVASDRASNSLIVTAPKEVLVGIESMVKEVDGGAGTAQMTAFYPVNSTDPTALARSLQVNYPKALLTGDITGGGVFATASLDEHKQIRELIEQVNAVPSKLPSLKSFTVKNVSASSIARGLTDAFGRRSEVGVTMSEPTNTVFVVGSRESLQIAEKIVEQLDAPATNRQVRSLRVFPVEGLDSEVAVEAIESAFQQDPRPVDVRYDRSSSRIYVFAEPDQLVQIEQVLASLRPEPRELQVLQLVGLDPFVAKDAIEALYFDTPYNQSPVVTVDHDRQQLLIKASAQQQQQVRSLLEQMGNKAGAKLGEPRDQRAQPGSSQIRFVPMPRNSQRALEALQQVWPTVRGNPLQVLPQAEAAKEQREDSSDAGAGLSSEKAVLVSQPTAQIAQDSRDADELPVVIVLGENQWTLASADLQALDELERVLELVRSPRATPYLASGNYSLYLLNRASASEVQQTLEQLLRSERSSEGRRPTSMSDLARRVKIVADSRTNALIVSGSTSDRQLIEELLGVLDSDELIGTLQQLMPTSIMLQSANATQVETVLKVIYRAQLATSASRKPIQIPEGVSAEVTTLLQQLNAESASPLLTMTSDETTNSIIVRAPRELTEEIQRFVSSLDSQTANTPSRRVDLIRLKSANTQAIEAALKRLMTK